MDRTLAFASIIVLALVPASYAADGDVFSGDLFLGGNAVNLDHKSGKFNEYNAIGPGLVGGGNASLDNDRYYLNAEGSYLGEDDMYLKLKGGKWGSFKYSVFYTEFPHNYSFGDKSVFINPGSEFQTLAPGHIPVALQFEHVAEPVLRREDQEEGRRRRCGSDGDQAFLLQL